MIFVLALIFGFGIGLAMDLGGPDSPGLVLPFLGFAIAISAVMSEGVALSIKTIRRRVLHRQARPAFHPLQTLATRISSSP